MSNISNKKILELVRSVPAPSKGRPQPKRVPMANLQMAKPKGMSWKDYNSLFSGNRPGQMKSLSSSIPPPIISANYSRLLQKSEPRIQGTYKECRVHHRELLDTLIGSTAYTVQKTYKLNPGDRNSFLWLSSLAQNWEFYRFNSLKYEFHTRIGSTSVGSVTMVPDYNTDDGPPVSEIVAGNFDQAVEDSPIKDISIRLNPQDLLGGKTRKYVRINALLANEESNDYDSGVMYFITNDCADSTTVLGKIWVEYDVTFMVPTLPPSGLQATQFLQKRFSAPVTGSPFAGTLTIGVGSTPLCGIGTAGVFSNLPLGRSLIWLQMNGTSSQTWASSSLVGCTIAEVSASDGTTVNQALFLVDVTLVANNLTLNCGTIVGGTQSTVRIIRVPPFFGN